MGQQSESDVLGVEMEKVKEGIRTLFEWDDTFFAKIEKRDVETISSRDMRIPLELRPGGRTGHFDPNGGDLGLGSGITYDKAVISSVHLKHAIQWTKQSQWSTDDSRKATINTFKRGLAKAMSEFRRNIDALCMTDGTGVMATISAVSTAAGKDTYTCNAAGDGFDIRLLRFGGPYSVYNAALTTRRPFVSLEAGLNAGEAAIDLYDIDAKQVRFNGAAAGAIATDKIVFGGLTATPPVSLFGLPYHHSSASSGSWLGLDRATTPEIRANSVAASGALALPLARLALNKIGRRVGLDMIPKTIAFMHPCQKQAYEGLGQLVSVIQKQAKDEALNLYFGDGMQLAGAPIVTGYSADKTRIDFVVLDMWGRAELKPPRFYDEDGVKIFPVRGSSGGIATSSLYYIVADFNLFITNPAMASYISGLSIPTGY